MRMKRIMSMVTVFVLLFSLMAGIGINAKAKTKVSIKVDNEDDFKKMKIGQKTKIKVKVSPGKAEYSTSNKKIADVEKNGYVVAVAPGSAKITVKSQKDSKVQVSFRVTVVKMSVKKFSFQSNEFCYAFIPNGTDADADNDPSDEPDDTVESCNDEIIEWNEEDDTGNNTYFIKTQPDQLKSAQFGEYFLFSSSDPTVATVDRNGIITVLKIGVTEITATLKSDKKKKATMKLTVISGEEEYDSEGESGNGDGDGSEDEE